MLEHNQQIKAGIFDISNFDYHNNAAISRSMITEFKKSPFHFYAKYIAKTVENNEVTAAMKIGNAVHTYVLERKKFDDIYIAKLDLDVEMPAAVLLKDVGRAEYEKYKTLRDSAIEYKQIMQQRFDVEAENKIVLTKHELQKIQNMSDSLLSRKIEKELLSSGINEQSIFFKDEKSGLMCKSRPDVLSLNNNIIIDLKTTTDASLKSCARSIYNYNYHIQAAMAVDAAQTLSEQNIDNFAFVFVEKDAPYASAVYILDAEYIELGRTEYRKILQEMRKCFDQNDWPSYEMQSIRLSD